ncbi:MAG TPA: class II glutamine amidotransferase [Gammaproteobacteria bacterium]|nr:class II glutamine amidotransferase [Gammaproteobacteria bacterium]
MCRLYALHATHPTRVGRELIESQNSLMAQSRRDETGGANPDGWGVGYWLDGRSWCLRQAHPASESPRFRKKAGMIKGQTVLGHVRRATAGEPALRNTHPFRHGDAMLVHNGHLGAFAAIRPRMLAAMSDAQRTALRGDTDSEHFFRLLMSLHARTAEPVAALRQAVAQVVAWSRAADAQAETGLNVFWSLGAQLAGTRLERSLWYVERDAPHFCEVTGVPDALVPRGERYRAVVVASERLSDENWRPVPDASVFHVGDDYRMRIEPLGMGD